jgi:hypothetical protein
MSTKKISTPKQPAPYGHYDSYKLNGKQVMRAVQMFESDFLEDSGNDEKTSILLALLRSFTYTTDNTERETMLLAAESALMPYIGAVSDAITELSIKGHQALIRNGGAQ